MPRVTRAKEWVNDYSPAAYVTERIVANYTWLSRPSNQAAHASAGIGRPIR